MLAGRKALSLSARTIGLSPACSASTPTAMISATNSSSLLRVCSLPAIGSQSKLAVPTP